MTTISALDDERGLILSWMLKMALVFAIVGVVLFDAGAILVNVFTLDSKADEIAVVLTTGAVGSNLNQQQLEARARELAVEAGARLVSIEVDSTARIVKVKLRRRADTLVTGRLSFTKQWTRATAEGQAGTT